MSEAEDDNKFSSIYDVIMPTPIIHQGDTVKTFFSLCVENQVLALPFCTRQSGDCDTHHISGFVSLKSAMGKDCIPNYMIDMATILHDDLDCKEQTLDKIKNLLCKPVETYLDENIFFVSPETKMVRVIALMEKFNSSWLFVAEEGQYKGIITRQLMAQKMIKMDC